MQGLTAGDTVLFLLSGGGSALFEQPLVPGAELQDITSQLLDVYKRQGLQSVKIC